MLIALVEVVKRTLLAIVVISLVVTKITLLVPLSYVLSILLAGKLTLVLSFVGSTGSTMISFILPGLFYKKLVTSGTILTSCKSLNFLSNFIVVYGFTIMVVCLYFNISSLELY